MKEFTTTTIHKPTNPQQHEMTMKFSTARKKIWKTNCYNGATNAKRTPNSDERMQANNNPQTNKPTTAGAAAPVIPQSYHRLW